MNKSGQFIKSQSVTMGDNESYSYFLPSEFPLQDLDLSNIQNTLSEADRYIGQLHGIENNIPHFELIIERYAQKEALLSSQIEGTQSSLVALLSDNDKSSKSMDIREVKNYFNALNHGIKRIKQDNFPLCLRLLKEIHEILMTDVRGGESGNTPGELRKTQNWIGGTRPSNAMFVPPAPEKVSDLMSNLEKYIHEDDIPPLVKCALLHYQFETIHPFCDGNGRTGRILITLYLIYKDIISSPILYLSLFFKIDRQSYYDALTLPRKMGNFESYIGYFLNGIIVTSKQVIETSRKINELQLFNGVKIADMNDDNAIILSSFIQKNPILQIKDFTANHHISFPTASKLFEKFVKMGILEQISEGQRNKRYKYSEYMKIFEEGTENYK